MSDAINKPRIALLGVPIEIGASQAGTLMGPAALRTAGKHITPALASDLYAMQAKAYAHLGDGTSALSCIRRAETAAERIRRGHEPDESDTEQVETLGDRGRRARGGEDRDTDQITDEQAVATQRFIAS